MVYGPQETSKDPAPLKVKQVKVGDRRYVVCWNMEQQHKDLRRREHLIENLEKALDTKSEKGLIGNKGFRKFIKSGAEFAIDVEKVAAEARFDGKWVLRTNLTEKELSTEDVALRYKDLWMVEEVFRSLKSILTNRPIYHHRNETIRGHVFSSFLALVMLKELLVRLDAKGHGDVEWDRVKMDLAGLTETELELDGKRFLIRDELQGDAGKALQAAGVAIPPTVISLKAVDIG